MEAKMPPMPLLQKDLDDLIARARQGSRQAQWQLLEPYWGYLLTIAQAEIARRHQAGCKPSDLVQSTLRAACEKFEQFRGGSEGELKGWLRRILLNALGDDERLAQKRHPVPQGRESSFGDWFEGIIAHVLDPLDKVAAEEQQQAALGSLSRLPEKYQEVLRLRCEADLSFAEIGKRLGVSENAAQKRYSRALHEFRRLMENPP
jgi:RNA polymerase sigma-70 factor (ECF subfamily)